MDPRTLALIVFQKLHQELGQAEDEPTDAQLRKWIQSAADLHPELRLRPGERPFEIVIGIPPSDQTNPAKADVASEVVVNVRHTMDALRMLWLDYHRNAAPSGDDPPD